MTDRQLLKKMAPGLYRFLMKGFKGGLLFVGILCSLLLLLALIIAVGKYFESKPTSQITVVLRVAA